tara:strand:+ start:12566 stop:14017 length:1452 start_codon:yes stop_codon:yes gene_type:complete
MQNTIQTTILDCYTDEPAGLGVPPYLGVYPRYIYGSLDGEANYLTIDDLRLYTYYNNIPKIPKPSEKTNIKTLNLSINSKNIAEILKNTSKLIIIAGVHTPGKYLSAMPGTLKEIQHLTKDLNCKKILTGPAIFGSQLYGGSFSEQIDPKSFDAVQEFRFDYNKNDTAIKGTSIIKQIPDLRIIEIETGRGCTRKKGCSFCLEPLKNRFEFRKYQDVLDEIKQFYKLGARHFRLGKQSCFYSYPHMEQLLPSITKACPDIKVLHIDNVNPIMVTEEKTKLIIKHCTEGNVAAFGVESFDKNVIKANNLNCQPEEILKAIKIINKHGREKGKNGMPKFLPGINLIFGLIEENKATFKENYAHLKEILDDNLLLRRINIREAVIFPGTSIAETGYKYLKKNRKYYWKWRNQIRQEIDLPMLKKLVPKGTILKKVRMEIYDGKKTFGRQIGTYPLIVGITKRVELGKFYNIKVIGHMLRSVVGEVI